MTVMSAEQGATQQLPWLARAAHAGARMRPGTAAVTVAVLLLACWGAVYVSGGTSRALPHLFYIPIVLATVPFALRGSLVVAVAAAVACGPLMPFDTVTGEGQSYANWIVRGAIFVAVGLMASVAQTLREQVYERQLSTEVRDALAAPTDATTAVDRSLVPQIRTVLERRAFHPVFQPIYSLADGHLVAVEALTRFDVEPYRTPDLWFAAAHEARLGPDLEVAAIRAAVEAARDLPVEVELSVNASPATLADPRLFDAVRSCAPRRLTVEITEHAVIEDYAGVVDKIHALRALGARIAVDDAGAGISSLKHIVHLGPDTIKLDISLAQGLGASPLRRALAGSLIEFAERTGAQLLVEGVEEVDDLVIWSTLGAHCVQGYLVGRPAALPFPLHSDLVTAHRVER